MCLDSFVKEYLVLLICNLVLISAFSHGQGMDETELESKDTDSDDDDDSTDPNSIMMIVVPVITITGVVVIITYRQWRRKQHKERRTASEHVNSVGIPMSPYGTATAFSSDIVISPTPTRTVRTIATQQTDLDINWQLRRSQSIQPDARENHPLPHQMPAREIGAGTGQQSQFTFGEDTQTQLVDSFQSRQREGRWSYRSSSTSSTLPGIYSIPEPANSRESWLGGNDIKRNNPIYDEDEPPPSYYAATGGSPNAGKE